MALGGSLCFLVVLPGSYSCGSWWFVVVLGGSWWFLMDLGGY